MDIKDVTHVRLICITKVLTIFSLNHYLYYYFVEQIKIENLIKQNIDRHDNGNSSNCKREWITSVGEERANLSAERFPLPLGAWDGLRYFIVALPEPSI